MAQAAVSMNMTSRTRLLVFPREHGAWGMLFVPLATGAAAGLMAGGRAMPLLPLIVAAFALFCLRTPVESLLGTTPMKAQGSAEKHMVVRYIGGFAAVAAIAIVALAWGEDQAKQALGLRWEVSSSRLLLLGLLAALLFLAQGAIRRLGRSARTFSQVTGAMGLTISAPAAYYVTTGRLGATAIALWLANWIFAGNQIHFVQLRIRGTKLFTLREKLAFGGSFLLGHALMWAILVAACSWRLLPWWALAAFLPVSFRGLAWFTQKPEKLDVHRLGFTELAHALTFGVLLVLAFAV